MTHADDAIIEVIDFHKYLVQFDTDSFVVRAESPAEAYRIAKQAFLQ